MMFAVKTIFFLVKPPFFVGELPPPSSQFIPGLPRACPGSLGWVSWRWRICEWSSKRWRFLRRRFGGFQSMGVASSHPYFLVGLSIVNHNMETSMTHGILNTNPSRYSPLWNDGCWPHYNILLDHTGSIWMHHDVRGIIPAWLLCW